MFHFIFYFLFCTFPLAMNYDDGVNDNHGDAEENDDDDD